MATTGTRRLMVDTGPLVAWLDADDKHHPPVAAFLAAFEGELISTWPVLTEVCHLLPEHMVTGFLRWLGAGGLSVVEVPASAATGLADRMDKYADLPMDLADASLIWVAEALGVLEVLTLDRRDFGVYRTARGRALRNLLDPALLHPHPLAGGAVRLDSEAPVAAKDLASRIRARFVGLGDVELSVSVREPVRAPPSFDEDSKAVRTAPSKRRAKAKRPA